DELTGERTTLLNRTLRKAGARARGESGSVVGKILQGLDGEARNSAMAAIRGWQARLVIKSFKSDDEAGKALARALADDIRQADNWTSPVELLVDQFKHFDQPEVQRQIVAMLRSWGDV